MKFTTLLITVSALTAAGNAWSDTARPGASADSWLAQRQALEQQDEARYSVCNAQRVDNPATRSIDFSAEGRRCLIAALGQAVSVQGTLVLLRNASVALRKNPADQALRTAALGAAGRARTQLAADLPALRERFKEEAVALDLAEFSIHLPQLHEQQQVWRLEAYAAALRAAR